MVQLRVQNSLKGIKCTCPHAVCLKLVLAFSELKGENNCSNLRANKLDAVSVFCVSLYVYVYVYVCVNQMI